jgi:hypothetical protein
MFRPGLLTPAFFSREIVDFFTFANIGPLIQGQYVQKEMKGYDYDNDEKRIMTKSIPDVETLAPTEDRLNDILDFIDTSILNPGSLTSLFALHAYYDKLQHSDDKTRLSASKDMRKYLRQIMIEIINRDADKLLNECPEEENERIEKARQFMVDCIDQPENINPDLGKFQTEYGPTEIFNPNWFLYAHFSKLISAGKLETLDTKDHDLIVEHQQKLISLARAYKNKMQQRK